MSSGRPISINDDIPATTKIRRDQHAKIKGIVDTNAKFPIVALGLVRDYVKSCSASQVVATVVFDNPDNPKSIIVHTKRGNDKVEVLGTSYHFNLKPNLRVAPPTL